MLTITDPDLLLHHGAGELNAGKITPCFEQPARLKAVLDALAEARWPAPIPPDPSARAAAEAAMRSVHAGEFIDFLKSAHADWRAAGRDGDALPLSAIGRRMHADRPPETIDGMLSYYAIDPGTPITADTWRTLEAGAACILTAVDRLQQAGSVFALIRPPGHHAGRDYYGGYGFVNMAAVAAQALREIGASRIAVLDVDYHHGNGTQDIFYDRGDVFYASIHADPRRQFPFFLGYADETGAGAGEGANLNLPLPWNTAWSSWSEALAAACARLKSFGAEALVVSLGFDAFERDPISHFKLTTEDFGRMGAAIAKQQLPTLFVFEGGYAIDALGANTLAALEGFSGR
ncbi:MAG: acetylpolyamine amidohydrolase AphB [Parvularculaceae bacterium]